MLLKDEGKINQIKKTSLLLYQKTICRFYPAQAENFLIATATAPVRGTRNGKVYQMNLVLKQVQTK